jgi:hypothetical protein
MIAAAAEAELAVCVLARADEVALELDDPQPAVSRTRPKSGSHQRPQRGPRPVRRVARIVGRVRSASGKPGARSRDLILVNQSALRYGGISSRRMITTAVPLK